jgi:hypothetical protein
MTAKLEVKDGAKPKFGKSRPVPYTIRDVAKHLKVGGGVVVFYLKFEFRLRLSQ